MPSRKKKNAPTLGWQDRLRIYSRDDFFASEIISAWEHVSTLRLALSLEIDAFVKRASEERGARRQEIVARHKAINGPRSTVETSRRILMLRDDISRLELVWREVWYRDWDGRGPKPKANYNTIPGNSESGTHLAKVKKGAHPDEIELLVEHEHEARRYRDLWSKTSKVAIALRYLGEAKLRQLEVADSIDEDDEE